MGTIRSLVGRYKLHQIDRFPRGQDCAASGRLVKGATASGGQRVGPAGTKMGTAHLTWAVSAAAPRCRRGTEPGHKSLARWANTPDTGNALRILAHKRAPAVYVRLKRNTAFALEPCLRTSGSSAGDPGASLDTAGRSLHRTAVKPRIAASVTAEGRLGPLSLSPARGLDTRAGACIGGV